MSLALVVNGISREFAELQSPATLGGVVLALGLKADRIAVELNGEIVAKAAWGDALVAAGDRLEVVHFVGGGSPG